MDHRKKVQNRKSSPTTLDFCPAAERVSRNRNFLFWNTAPSPNPHPGERLGVTEVNRGLALPPNYHPSIELAFEIL